MFAIFYFRGLVFLVDSAGSGGLSIVLGCSVVVVVVVVVCSVLRFFV